MNGHFGVEVVGFEGVHGGYGFGRRNVDGEMLLEFADALDFAIVNTWFKKEVRKMIIKQHKLLICVLDLKEKLVRPKVKFMKRCKEWKLKEAETEGIIRGCRQELQCQ